MMLTNLEQANKESKRAYWWLKGIDANDAKELGVLSKIKDCLSLLNVIDDITIDITITINTKTQQ